MIVNAEGEFMWTHKERAEYFAKLLKGNKLLPAKTVELGFWYGDFTKHLVDILGREVFAYGIDSFKCFTHYNRRTKKYHKVFRPSWKQNHWDNHYKGICNRFKLIYNVCIVRKTSEEAVWLLPDDLTYVFIDAGHDYHNVINDITLWEEKVKDGGILSGHDYKGKKYQEVGEAVDDYARMCNRKVNNPSHLIWWWKVNK